ncbi:MAG: CDP-6-deoxy-delta-3,4-glucoseen reductase [Pusillimonas sp.]|nr:CDP-6-deoxy-delta-3,4-glucoseen reductase [Pusillimonas sp.]
MSFKVVLDSNGKEFDASPGQNILAAALDAGISLHYSCRSGLCGACQCKILKGDIDHGDASLAYLTAEKRADGYAMLCQATARSDLVLDAQELSGFDGVKPRITPCRVAKLERVANDVMVLTIRTPMNENLLFVAGQYVDFLFPDGKTRSYSIASIPSAQGVTQLELHIRHMPGGLFTDHVFSKMKIRELLTMEGPFGTFYVRENSDRPMVFVASGTGFAPIKSMLSVIFAKGLNQQRSINFYWGGRTRDSLYMHDLVAQWADEHENFKYIPVLSEATEACSWTGRVGNVHLAVMEDFPDLSGYQVYACGAPAMVNAAKHDFIEKCNLPEGEFFADEFLSELDRLEEKSKQ